MRKPPSEWVQAHVDQDQVLANSHVKSFHRHGITFQVPARAVTNLIESPFFIGIHR